MFYFSFTEERKPTVAEFEEWKEQAGKPPSYTFIAKMSGNLVLHESFCYNWCWMNKSETKMLCKCINFWNTKCKASLQVTKNMLVVKRDGEHSADCGKKPFGELDRATMGERKPPHDRKGKKNVRNGNKKTDKAV